MHIRRHLAGLGKGLAGIGATGIIAVVVGFSAVTGNGGHILWLTFWACIGLTVGGALMYVIASVRLPGRVAVAECGGCARPAPTPADGVQTGSLLPGFGCPGRPIREGLCHPVMAVMADPAHILPYK